MSEADGRGVKGLTQFCGNATQRLFGALAFRDVFDLTDVIKGVAISTPKNRNAQLSVHDRPVLTDIALSELVSRNIPTSELARECKVGVEIVGMGDGLKSELCQLGGAVAEDFAEYTIDADETPIERNQCHPNRRLIDCETKSLL